MPVLDSPPRFLSIRIKAFPLSPASSSLRCINITTSAASSIAPEPRKSDALGCLWSLAELRLSCANKITGISNSKASPLSSATISAIP